MSVIRSKLLQQITTPPTIVLQKSAFNKSRVLTRAGKIGAVPKLRFLLNGASTKTQEAEFIAVLEIAD